MRVGLVSPYDLGVPGGVQDQVLRIAGWLRESGHEAVVVGPGTDGPDDVVLLGPSTAVAANRSTAQVRLDPTVGRRLAAALADVDVIHVHEPLVPAVSPAALRVDGPAKVATFHADPTRWVRRLYRYGRSGIRLALRPAGVTTAVSPVAGSAIDGVVDYRIIPNGIALEGFATGPKVPGRVAFLGRDDERKGLPVLLDAWRRVRETLPDATLAVLGASRAEPIEGVRFFGRVGDDAKQSELAAAAVFCAPNLGSESFGITLAEAMASGCAIVASAIPAFEHVAGADARFVEPGRVDELAAAIIDVVGDPEETARLGAAAVQRVQRFDGRTVTAQYIHAYEDAVALRRHGSPGF